MKEIILNYFKKHLFLLPSLLLFCFMFVWNFISPLYDDDIYFANSSFINIIKSGVSEYFNGNARFFGQLFSRVLLMNNGIITSLFNALFFILLTWIIFLLANLNSSVKDKENLKKLCNYIFTVCLIFIFTPSFGQVFLWRAGSGNYLWITTIGFIYLYVLFQYEKIKSGNRIINMLLFSFLLLLSIISGWGNENFSGGIIFIIFIYILYLHHNKKNILSHVIFMMFSIIGYLFLILAPGNKARTISTLGENYFHKPLMLRAGEGFLKVNDYIFSNSLIFIFTILILLFVITVYFNYNKKVIVTALIWTVSGLLVTYAMSLAPVEQDTGRVYFGATMLFIVAIMTLISNLPLTVKKIRAIYTFGFSLVVLFCFFQVSNGLYDSLKSDKSIYNRYSYIKQQKKENNDEIIKISPLSYAPQTKYSINYGLSDIGNNPMEFPNYGYFIYFGVKVKN